MNTFAEVEELFIRLRDGDIDRYDAVKQIDAAREFLMYVSGKLRKIKGKLQDDPLMLWRLQQEKTK